MVMMDGIRYKETNIMLYAGLKVSEDQTYKIKVKNMYIEMSYLPKCMISLIKGKKHYKVNLPSWCMRSIFWICR